MDKIIQFEHFNKTKALNHCYSTRRGGVSSGVFSSMNLGLGRNDEEASVLENYDRLCAMIGLTKEQLVLSNQVHKDVIRKIDVSDIGKGLIGKSDIIGVDGLITNQVGIGLTTFYADCVPLFFYDPTNKAIGLAHAGWRGSVLKIGQKMIGSMGTEFGSKARDLLVGIGPSIGQCCYEVSADVKKEFDLSFNDDIMAKIVIPSMNNEMDDLIDKKYMLDLWEANRLTLIEAGVLPEHIEVSGLCTKCHQETFFSHRVMGNNRGSQVAILALK